ncbi:MAG: DUF4190 domain-containing protein [Acidimicrobiia bacterium]
MNDDARPTEPPYLPPNGIPLPPPLPPTAPPGYAPPPGPPQNGGPYTPSAPLNGLALASMILGIVSIPALCFAGLGGFVGVAGVVLGIIALRQINRAATPAGGKGIAIAGIACGATGGALGLLYAGAIVILSSTGF